MVRVCIRQSHSFFVLFLWQIWELLCYGILRFAEPRGTFWSATQNTRLGFYFEKPPQDIIAYFPPIPSVVSFWWVVKSIKIRLTPTSPSFFRLIHGEWLVLVTKFLQSFSVRKMLSKMWSWGPRCWSKESLRNHNENRNGNLDGWLRSSLASCIDFDNDVFSRSRNVILGPVSFIHLVQN